MKSKMLLLLLLAALAMSCAESFVSVPIPFMEKRAADFSASQDVFFIDFICDVPEAGFNAEAEIRRTFAEEIPFAIDKKIALLEPDNWAMIRAILQRYRLNIDIQYEDSVFFRNVFKAHPRSLFFTGKLKLDIKRMGVVKETRDEMGNRKNGAAVGNGDGSFSHRRRHGKDPQAGNVQGETGTRARDHGAVQFQQPVRQDDGQTDRCAPAPQSAPAKIYFRQIG
jgi:hypothetical protein